jgi:hypothetical protein
MNSKNTLKSMIENFIERSMETSQYIKKLAASVTIIAVESKKLAEVIFTLNQRVNDHEELLLKLIEMQRHTTKDQIDSIDIALNKEKFSKPN